MKKNHSLQVRPVRRFFIYLFIFFLFLAVSLEPNSSKILSETMGNSSSMLTQYDIEEVQQHCQRLFS
ncbi:hypothetical protein V6N13_048682 [Hibiscus sabdariffa]|uniref:Uncharacterized protein n=1 Tax=Hibiscus sabdariffa TaxID=183260 RepID=A0ABR2DIV1_9ROSI